MLVSLTIYYSLVLKKMRIVRIKGQSEGIAIQSLLVDEWCKSVVHPFLDFRPRITILDRQDSLYVSISQGGSLCQENILFQYSNGLEMV